MRVLVGARSDVGRVRERNEDSYLVKDRLFAVADGMGGHRGGDVASSLSLETVSRADLPDEGALPTLIEQIKRAHRTVLERGESDRSLRGMGTTLTAILIDGDKAHVAHVGDSRAYRLHDGSLQQLTEDHTLVQQMVREGKLRPDQARHHPQRNIVTRALGVDEDLDVEELTLPLAPGDKLLIASDGLSGMVDEDEIGRILAAGGDPQAAADALVDAANRAGGEDNITVIVLAVVEGDDPGRGSPTGEAAAAVRPPAGQGSAEGDVAAPEERARGRGVRPGRLVAWTAGVALLVAAAVVGVRMYLDHQWYVGQSNGRVAIYNGIPTRVLGFDLSHVSETTDLPASRAQALQPWQDLADGITANSLADARSIVNQIRRDLAPSTSGGGSGGSSPGPTPTPTGGG